MTEPTDTASSEIDLMQIVLKLWKGRKTILIATGIFFVLGVLLVIISPREYTSKVSLLVEPGGSNPAANSAILKQLSLLTGVPTTASADALTPSLYPLVVGSVYFRLEVLNQQVTDSKTRSKMSLSQYFDKHPRTTLQGILMKYSIGLPGTILLAIRGKKKAETTKMTSHQRAPASILPNTSPVPGLRLSIMGPASSDSASLELTPEEKSKIGAISSCIKAEIKKGSVNLLEITVNIGDPMVAKDLAGSVVNTLTRYIIDYRTRKVKNDREFIEGLHADAEKRYKQAQQTLASYRDRNQNVVQSSALAQGENLQAEYNLAFNVYNSLSQLLEQAKINVQENTHVFTIIEPPSDAVKTSSSSNIILIMIFLGILTGIGVIFGKPAFAKFKKTLQEAEPNLNLKSVS